MLAVLVLDGLLQRNRGDDAALDGRRLGAAVEQEALTGSLDIGSRVLVEHAGARGGLAPLWRALVEGGVVGRRRAEADLVGTVLVQHAGERRGSLVGLDLLRDIDGLVLEKVEHLHQELTKRYTDGWSTHLAKMYARVLRHFTNIKAFLTKFPSLTKLRTLDHTTGPMAPLDPVNTNDLRLE